MSRNIFICAALLFLGSPNFTRAFVFYPVGNAVLKWNVKSSQVKPTAVNPTTKAIRYYIASDTYSTSNKTNEVNAVRASFDQWQKLSGGSVKFEFMGFISSQGLDTRFDDMNVVFWTKNRKVNGGTEDLTNRRGWTSVTYAVDGSILDADIVLNAVDYQWFTDANDTANQGQFVESIVSHEIGHFLGLDHSPAGGATVVDAGNGINTNTGLSADEISALRYLYPEGTNNRGAIKGIVRKNGVGILGASVIAEDAAGNIAGATVTQSSGSYAIYSLAAGTYKLRVTPLDPATSSVSSSLQRISEIASDYRFGDTSFLATTNLALLLPAGETKTQDVNVTGVLPPFRITSLSKPTQADLVTVVRYAVSLTQGQSNYFIGVSSPDLQNGSVLSVSGDGLTVGPTVFYGGRVSAGLNSLVVPISVSSNATPGLRSLVVSQGGILAYANGYLEIASPIPDYNFDGLDDRYQRKFWRLWTAPEAAPGADPDSDGFSNGFEYRTSTDPTNSVSNRLVLQQPLRGSSGPQLNWVSDPGKTYQLYNRTTLAPGAWQLFGQPVTAQGETASVPLDFGVPSQFFQLQLKK